MKILIDEKQYLEIMELLNMINREKATLLASFNLYLNDNERCLYENVKRENKKYLSLMKQLDKNKKNNIRKRLIAAVEKWVECEVTGDEAMTQIIELLEIKLTN
ncbi:hypothetical protein HYI16_17195 [Clostridium botulinum]|uniref:hypothetical protein n=1 Tax=Clostridium botulinum TaxID=1491 RepID=UPI001C9AB1B1|nr:hypothetical protein [Clostridium botulinum]MBY7043777.1 hypothetical protein [Clostridium botulinum]